MATRVLTIGSTSGSGEGETISSGSGELRWKYRTGLGVAGALIVLMALWAGSAPFFGDAFGISPDGLARWHWDLGRGMLAVLPAGAALLAGLALIRLARSADLGLGRVGVMTAGLIAVAAGCWFVIGPVAWQLLDGHRYLLASGAAAALEREVAFALGPGLFLAVLGAFVCEFAALRSDSRPLQVVTPPVEAPVAAPISIPTEGPR